MSASQRKLPQWLINIDNRNVSSGDKNRNINRDNKRLLKKTLSVCDNSCTNSLMEKEQINTPSTNSSTEVDTMENIKITTEENGVANFSEKKVKRTRELVMSDSEDDDDGKSDLSLVLEKKINDVAVNQSTEDQSADLNSDVKSILKCDEMSSENISVKLIKENNISPSENESQTEDNDVISEPTISGNAPTNNISEDDSTNDKTTNSVNTNSASSTVRPKCKYGSQCYRKNHQHRQDFSHPNDDDYEDNRPECEYGLDCYRKNPLHRQHYKHTKKGQKPRKAKRLKKTVSDDTAHDEDDYDLDDPFIDDGSSDEYMPSGSGSETDFGDEEGEGSEKEDVEDVNVNKGSNIRKLKRKERH